MIGIFRRQNSSNRKWGNLWKVTFRFIYKVVKKLWLSQNQRRSEHNGKGIFKMGEYNSRRNK